MLQMVTFVLIAVYGSAATSVLLSAVLKIFGPYNMGKNFGVWAELACCDTFVVQLFICCHYYCSLFLLFLRTNMSPQVLFPSLGA
jgi:hypothetical protein